MCRGYQRLCVQGALKHAVVHVNKGFEVQNNALLRGMHDCAHSGAGALRQCHDDGGLRSEVRCLDGELKGRNGFDCERRGALLEDVCVRRLGCHFRFRRSWRDLPMDAECRGYFGALVCISWQGCNAERKARHVIVHHTKSRCLWYTINACGRLSGHARIRQQACVPHHHSLGS